MARPGHFGDSAGNWNEVCQQLWAELGMRVPIDALDEIRRIRRKRGGKQGNTEQKTEAKILLAIRQGIPWEHAYGRKIHYTIQRRDGGRDELSNIRLGELEASREDYLDAYNQQFDFEPPAEWPEKSEKNVKIKAPEGEFTIPTEGEHIAKLTEFEDQGEQPDKFNPGQTTHRMQLVWQLKSGARQFQWVKVSLHPLSRFFEIATALLGENPPEEIEVEDLIGKSAIITIQHYSGQDGRKKSKIVDIRPVRFKGRKLPAPEPIEEEPGEVEEAKDTDEIPF